MRVSEVSLPVENVVLFKMAMAISLSNQDGPSQNMHLKHKALNNRIQNKKEHQDYNMHIRFHFFPKSDLKHCKW